MSDSLRDIRLKHWLNDFLSDDNQSSCPSVLSLLGDKSTGKIINFKKLKNSDPLMYQRWESLQELREEVLFEEERFLSLLPSDHIIGDDNQSSCPSVPSLHSDWSKDKMIDFKKLEESDPIMYQIWRSLQKLREDLQIKERQFARLPSDHFLRDDDQPSCPSVQTFHSYWSNGKGHSKEEKSDTVKAQRGQSLEELREHRQLQSELLLADLFLRDDDQPSCPSVQIFHSYWSNGKGHSKEEKSDTVKYRRWQLLQELRELLQIEEDWFLADLPPDFIIGDDNRSSCSSDSFLCSDRSNGKGHSKEEKSDTVKMEEEEEMENEEMHVEEEDKSMT